jgi:hypothetical protein
MTSKSATELFWSKVNILGLDECWEWTASLKSNGYGSFRSGPDHGLSSGAHRVAYELTHGEIASGLHVLHSCDHRKCCNPKHLYLGTNQDNVDDKVRKNRQSHTIGMTNGMARLTEVQVKSIKSDPRSLREIAKDYEVSHVQIGYIRRGIQWGHIVA